MADTLSPIWACLQRAAERAPHKVALVQGERRTTYDELCRGMSAVSTFLRKNGLEPGDRVALLCDNSAEFVAAYFGIQMARGISVALNTQYTPPEINRIVAHSQARIILKQEKHHLKMRRNSPGPSPGAATFIVEKAMEGEAPAAAKPASRHGTPMEDIAAIIYTSGTTGRPKGVTLTHMNFASNAESIVRYLGLDHNDSVMAILPFSYSYGMSLLTTHMMVGGMLVLENSLMYPKKILDRMAERDVTGFAGVPTTFSILLNKSDLRKYSFPKLRYLTQAGGPMSPLHAGALKEAIPGASVFIMYGQTEATARLTYLKPEELVRKSGSIGKAIPGVKIELIKEDGTPAEVGEEGEIVASGPNIMAGYWNDPVETRNVLREGKLYTGDHARMDEEGFLYIIGRRSDMIKSGAHRISPKEIEEAILEIEDVHEVAAFGIVDETLGESVCVVIVVKDGCSCDARMVKEHCSTRLASFKIPRDVHFATSLPKTSSGKAQRFRLKEIYKRSKSVQ